MIYLRLFVLDRSPLISSLFIILFSIMGTESHAQSKNDKESGMTFSEMVLPPASGKKPDSIAVLFHGYGDTGENFLLMGALISEFLPDTLFVALDGPMTCKDVPSGKQWLNLSDTPSQQLKDMNALTSHLSRYLDDLRVKYDIPPEKVMLIGFSQGARIALHLGLRLPKCAGIVAFSGSYLDDPKAHNLSRPPILIIHGIEDKKAPVSLARESYKQLDALKMPASLVLLPGIGHDITPQGLQISAEFLSDCLSGKMTN